MPFRTVFLFGLALLCTGLDARTQVDSEGMDDPGAWSARYLPSGARDFPAHLWADSDPETLLALMQPLRPRSLDPLARTLLRRVILSPARVSQGEMTGDLEVDRIRLMLALGELHAAADFAARSGHDMPEPDGRRLMADLALIEGQGGTMACEQQPAVPSQTTTRQVKLRIVCALLQDNYPAAELATELAVADGLDDPWFVAAVFAASSDAMERPAARFDSGLNVVLSIKAHLRIDQDKLPNINPGLAAVVINHPDIPPRLKIQLARRASRFGIISPERYRNILLHTFRHEQHIPVSRMEKALFDLSDQGLDPGARADRLGSVLDMSRGNFRRHRVFAKWFLPDLKKLPKTAETSPHAVTFAQAALVAGDMALSREWLMQLDQEILSSHGTTGDDEPGDGGDDQVHAIHPDFVNDNEPGFENSDKQTVLAPFYVAVLNALALLPRADQSIPGNLDAVERQLVKTADTPDRQLQAARILMIWDAFGLPVGSRSRMLIRTLPDTGKRIAPGRIVALQAASRNGAIAETALLVLSELDNQSNALSSADLAVLIRALRKIGAFDIALDLAVEAVMANHTGPAQPVIT